MTRYFVHAILEEEGCETGQCFKGALSLNRKDAFETFMDNFYKWYAKHSDYTLICNNLLRRYYIEEDEEVYGEVDEEYNLLQALKTYIPYVYTAKSFDGVIAKYVDNDRIGIRTFLEIFDEESTMQPSKKKARVKEA